MAKLNRESKLRERRAEKNARKDARKQSAADGVAEPSEMLDGDDRDDAPDIREGDAQPAVTAGLQPSADA